MFESVTTVRYVRGLTWKRDLKAAVNFFGSEYLKQSAISEILALLTTRNKAATWSFATDWAVRKDIPNTFLNSWENHEELRCTRFAAALRDTSPAIETSSWTTHAYRLSRTLSVITNDDASGPFSGARQRLHIGHSMDEWLPMM